jgi:hypothetical protein
MYLLVLLLESWLEVFSEVPPLRLTDKFRPLFLNRWLYNMVPLMLGEEDFVRLLLYPSLDLILLPMKSNNVLFE